MQVFHFLTNKDMTFKCRKHLLHMEIPIIQLEGHNKYGNRFFDSQICLSIPPSLNRLSIKELILDVLLDEYNDVEYNENPHNCSWIYPSDTPQKTQYVNIPYKTMKQNILFDLTNIVQSIPTELIVICSCDSDEIIYARFKSATLTVDMN